MPRRLTSLALLLALAASCSYAFDTGHHSDLTRAALSRRGFSDHAIKIVQLANWLADYVTNSPTTFDASVKRRMEDLHFDNLDTTAKVENYWRNLAANTSAEVKDIMKSIALSNTIIARHETIIAGFERDIGQAPNQAAKDSLMRRKAEREAARDKEQGDKQKALTELLVVIGVSLHAVQDFYSHSNWTEAHYPLATTPQYQTMTYWREMRQNQDVLPSQRNPAADYHTGWYPGPRASQVPPATNDRRHGPYVNPPNPTNNPNNEYLNHDSYCRPRWDRAYVFAYAGTLEWIDAVIAWADKEAPGLLQQELNDTNYDLARRLPGMPKVGDLDGSLRFAKSVSEYLAKPPEDGHWKGNGSGWGTAWTAASAKWVLWQNSPWVGVVRGPRPGRLVKDVYHSPGIIPGGFTSPAGGQAPDGKVFKIRTLQISKPANTYVFARITVDEGTGAAPLVNSMTYDEAVIKTPAVANFNPFWHTIHFADTNVTRVRINYRLLSQSGADHGEGVFALNPAQNRQPNGEFLLDFNQGTLSGDIPAPVTAALATLGGLNRFAQIIVTSEPLR